MPRIQKHVYLAFEVRGKNLIPEKTNPVLHEFYRLLNKIKFERGGLKIVTTDKDPANLEQIDSVWVKGSIHVNMEVINFPGQDHMTFGIDHNTGAFIINEMKKLKVEHKGIEINVLEVTFSASDRKFPQVWPRMQETVVSF